MLDLDTQANLTLMLLRKLQQGGPTVHKWLSKKKTFAQVVQEYNLNHHVLPSSSSLADIEKEMRKNHAILPDHKKHNVYFYLRAYCISRIDYTELVKEAIWMEKQIAQEES